jgi:hypothetical protein
MPGVKKGNPVEFTREYVAHYDVGDGENDLAVFGIAIEDERSDRTVMVELADGTTYLARYIHAYAWGGWLPDNLEETYLKHNPSDQDF